MKKHQLKNLAGIVGGILVFLAIVAGLVVFFTPSFLIPELEADTSSKEEEALDPLDEGFEISIAEVTLPEELPLPQAFGKKEPESPDKLTAIPPTATIMAKGQGLLEKSLDNGNTLPRIFGDFSKIGFNRYFKAMLKSGGLLAVYDRSAGLLPVCDLDSLYRIRHSTVVGYEYTRPRFLDKPYPAKMAQSLQIVAQRYPGADLRLGFILPASREAYILGAIHHVLKDSLYTYQTLSGNYTQGAQGKLVFTIHKGRKASGTVNLNPPIVVQFALLEG